MNEPRKPVAHQARLTFELDKRQGDHLQIRGGEVHFATNRGRYQNDQRALEWTITDEGGTDLFSGTPTDLLDILRQLSEMVRALPATLPGT